MKKKKTEENDKYVVLERGKHYTLTALAEFLNQEHGGKPSKSSGKPSRYSAMDVQKYLTRGHLPEYLGCYGLTEFRDGELGIKMVVIGEPVKIEKGKKKKEENEDKND